MAVAVKRVYEDASLADGVRVLVDRLWPRGLRKEEAAVKFWLRDLAPSTELRQWFHANPEAWGLFRRRYLKELASPKASAAVEKLHHLAEGKRRLTLLYGSRNQKRNNALVLKELLEGMRKPPSSVGRGALGRGRIRKAKRQ
ncbi:MAG: DUF488 family protein [Terriglobales bacterium]